jgi:phosphoglycerate dehydrogenase-like enzyme
MTPENNSMSKASVIVSFQGNGAYRRAVEEILGDVCNLVYLPDLAAEARGTALANADALIANNVRVELESDEFQELKGLKLIQLLSAGVDHAPFGKLPADVPVAYVPGAYADAMAEHAVAMALAAAKRLFVEDRNMRQGQFNQFTMNRRLSGGTCAIVGFGGAGRATARLLRCLGMKIHAVNRSGKTPEPVEFIGTAADLERVLRPADLIVITLPLTRKTIGLIGEQELAWLKRDGILVNISRGEIIDEGALYKHLSENPEFTACIEAWWIEPVRHGEFRTNYPFLELPNVMAAPHNSATVPGAHLEAVRLGAENVRRVLAGGESGALVTDEERLV